MESTQRGTIHRIIDVAIDLCDAEHGNTYRDVAELNERLTTLIRETDNRSTIAILATALFDALPEDDD